MIYNFGGHGVSWTIEQVITRTEYGSKCRYDVVVFDMHEVLQFTGTFWSLESAVDRIEFEVFRLVHP